MGRAHILGLALFAALLFFSSLLLRELSHSVFAKSRGLPVREITLFALGGVSQIEKNPESARTEFWMVFVGPLTSAAIGAVSLLLVAVLPGQASPLSTVLSRLGYMNLALAGFNLTPGYPLDGGRILRAAISWKSGDKERSTRTAAKVARRSEASLSRLGSCKLSGALGLAASGSHSSDGFCCRPPAKVTCSALSGRVCKLPWRMLCPATL